VDIYRHRPSFLRGLALSLHVEKERKKLPERGVGDSPRVFP
jgi:hypothetical protein